MEEQLTEFEVILVTTPSEEVARDLTSRLLQSKLAACVNILPGITSLYHWQGKLEESKELLMLIKARKASFAEIEKLVQANHPYEVPEVVSIRLESISGPYAKWLQEETLAD